MTHLQDLTFLPAPLWIVTLLHLVTLTLHFLAMNFVLGGALLLVGGRIPDRWGNPAVLRYLRLLPSMMAAVITLGVAPLLFAQLVYFRPLYSASIVSGWWWLLIVGAVILAYYLIYAAAWRRGEARPGRGILLFPAVAALLYVSLVYSTVFSMAERPELMARLYAGNPSGWAWNAEPGSWGFRWLHMILGAITVGGYFVGLLSRGDEATYRLGKGAFLWGLAAASVAGLAYLFTLGPSLGPLMRTPGPWYLLAAIVLSLGSLHFFFRKRFGPAGILLGVSMLGMTATRHQLRDLLLAGSFDPASLPIRPQWGIFVLFLACFLVAVGLVGLMVRLFLGGKRVSA